MLAGALRFSVPPVTPSLREAVVATVPVTSRCRLAGCPARRRPKPPSTRPGAVLRRGGPGPTVRSAVGRPRWRWSLAGKEHARSPAPRDQPCIRGPRRSGAGFFENLSRRRPPPRPGAMERPASAHLVAARASPCFRRAERSGPGSRCSTPVRRAPSERAARSGYSVGLLGRAAPTGGHHGATLPCPVGSWETGGARFTGPEIRAKDNEPLSTVEAPALNHSAGHTPPSRSVLGPSTCSARVEVRGPPWG